MRTARLPAVLAVAVAAVVVGIVLVSSSSRSPTDPPPLPTGLAAQTVPPRSPLPPTPVPTGIEVPSSIDASGGSDVAAELQAFVDGVPDESTIVFVAGGHYRMSLGLRLTARRGLTFEGNGSTLEVHGCDSRSSPFELADHNERITIRAFTLLGGNTAGGTSDAFSAGCEYQAGVAIYQSTGIEISNVAIERMSGDCLQVDAGGSGYVWSEDVRFVDSSCVDNGRMGVAVLAARRVTVERVTFDRIALFVFDIEPYLAGGGAETIRFADNEVGTYGHSPRLTPHLFAADGASGSTVSDVVVTGNVVYGGNLSVDVTVPRRQRIEVSDNIAHVEARGPVMVFRYVDGLTVTGNIQPLAGRPGLYSIRDSTDVVVD